MLTPNTRVPLLWKDLFYGGRLAASPGPDWQANRQRLQVSHLTLRLRLVYLFLHRLPSMSGALVRTRASFSR
jgi:hypothetical protein